MQLPVSMVIFLVKMALQAAQSIEMTSRKYEE
jgi:hypothetical protein